MKLALGIEYNGSAYCGWQRQQTTIPSVQAYLENALSNIANDKITIYCAGRTDSGVHAIGQVIHFETKSYLDHVNWILGVNAHLPKDITVRWVKQVNQDFHARFSAIARRYYYIIYNNLIPSAILNDRVTHYSKPLDIHKMERAGQYLLGEHNFSSFRSVQCQSSTPWRYLYHLRVTRQEPYLIIIDIKANSFLNKMVRNIVGSLLEVGCGIKKESWIAELLTHRNRMKAASTAKAEGLYLVEVDYPLHFALPILSHKPLFLNFTHNDNNQ